MQHLILQFSSCIRFFSRLVDRLKANKTNDRQVDKTKSFKQLNSWF